MQCVENLSEVALKLTPKGFFFSESAMRFSNLQKKIFPITILNLKFKFPANNNKQQIQISRSLRIVIWNIFILEIWRLEKQITLSEKNPPLGDAKMLTHRI